MSKQENPKFADNSSLLFTTKIYDERTWQFYGQAF